MMTNDELPEITPLTDEEVAEIEAAYNPEMKMSPESDRRNRRWLGMLLDNQRLTAENKTLQDELDEAYTDLYTMRHENAKLRAELAEAALLINGYFTLEGEEQYMRWFSEISKWSSMYEERHSATTQEAG